MILFANGYTYTQLKFDCTLNQWIGMHYNMSYVTDLKVMVPVDSWWVRRVVYTNKSFLVQLI